METVIVTLATLAGCFLFGLASGFFSDRRKSGR